MSEVEYFHKDRHPRCCCAQCVSDEAEYEIADLQKQLDACEEAYEKRIEKSFEAYAKLEQCRLDQKVELEQLRAENARLREILTTIATSGFAYIDKAEEIAEAALGDDK